MEAATEEEEEGTRVTWLLLLLRLLWWLWLLRGLVCGDQMGVLTTACLEISDEGSGIRNLEGDTERDLPGEIERRGKEKNRLGLMVPEGEVVRKKTMVFSMRGIFIRL